MSNIVPISLLKGRAFHLQLSICLFIHFRQTVDINAGQLQKIKQLYIEYFFFKVKYILCKEF